MAVAAALDIRGLHKRFGDTRAVRGLDLRLRAGEFYALLGPNGAGKTTTLRMVAGLLKPDSGSIHIFGEDLAAHPERAKQALAWVPDEPMLYDRLRGGEYLEFVAGLWRLDAAQAAARAGKLLQWLGLWEQRNAYAETYSKGMRQKLALAGALHLFFFLSFSLPSLWSGLHSDRWVEGMPSYFTAMCPEYPAQPDACGGPGIPAYRPPQVWLPRR